MPRPKDIIPNSDESQMHDHSDDVPSEITEPRKGKRVRKDPRTYNEAMQSRDAAFWKEKMKVDGTIDKFMARLIIQGFRQKEGIDYFDTYAPVAHITTIRLLLALAAIHNLVVHQMDAKTTLLNGDLDEEVYMKQPEGFVMSGNEHKVCKLVKSLYGLKQAPRQWHQKFDGVVLSSGFHLNQYDKCVYRKFDDSGKGVIICLYVDDMLIFGTDQNQVDKTKKFLSSRFSMIDMGETNVILGIKIKRENKGTVITQSHYIEKVLKKFNRKDCSPVSTPMDQVEKLKPNTRKPVDQLKYSRAIGCFMGGAISWASKKQTCITSSTMKSEFVALADAGKEAKWLRNLIHEISILPKPIAPISIRVIVLPQWLGHIGNRYKLPLDKAFVSSIAIVLLSKWRLRYTLLMVRLNNETMNTTQFDLRIEMFSPEIDKNPFIVAYNKMDLPDAYESGNHSGITQPQKLTRRCEITAILVLYGLPRLKVWVYGMLLHQAETCLVHRLILSIIIHKAVKLHTADANWLNLSIRDTLLLAFALPTLKIDRGKDKLAVIRASGNINRVEGSMFSPISGIIAETVIEKIRNVRDSKKYKAVIIRIDSPGVDALSSDLKGKVKAVGERSSGIEGKSSQTTKGACQPYKKVKKVNFLLKRFPAWQSQENEDYNTEDYEDYDEAQDDGM
nr:zinc finger, CCHC-type [Tanacetum cinerariifolium]